MDRWRARKRWESQTERTRWRKCSAEGGVRGEDREAGEEILKIEKESRRGRMVNSAGEEEIRRGREIPSVLQIGRETATAEGQDRDFNTDSKGTESSALSHRNKHNY